MSGIIGSKLNIRGSGLVGSLGTDGQHLLSSGAGKTNVFETSTSGVSAAELVAVRQDISTLALHSAVADNKAAFNLTNSFIDQFQDDTGIATETNGDRNSDDEYWSTIVAATPVHAVPTGVAISGGNITRAAEATAITKSGDGGTGNTSDATAYDFIAYTTGSSVSGIVIVNLGADYSIEKMDLGKGRGSGDPRSILMKYHISDTIPGTVVDFTGASAVSKTYKGSTALLSNFASNGTADWAALGSNSDGTINTVTGFTPFTAQYISLKWGSADFHDANANWSEMKFYKAQVSASATGTLISAANTVTARTAVSGVMLYADNAGTASLGTDLKIYFACDGGAGSPDWTEASYTAVTPVFSSGIKMVKLGAVTGLTSGTDVRYKAVFANQSDGSKDTRIHGIGLNY
jgi:hypothetical protein